MRELTLVPHHALHRMYIRKHNGILEVYTFQIHTLTISQVTFLPLLTIAVLRAPVFSEYVLPRQLHLLYLYQLLQLASVLLEIEHVVRISTCDPNNALPQTVDDSKILRMLLQTKVEIVVLGLR